MSLGFGSSFFACRTGNWHGRTGLGGVEGSIFAQQDRPHFVEQALDLAAVLQGAFEHWHHGQRHIEAAPSSIVGEGQQIVGMLLSAGAGPAIGSDAGLAHLGHGPFESGPESQQLIQEALLSH